jgi:hypothetical protein
MTHKVGDFVRYTGEGCHDLSLDDVYEVIEVLSPWVGIKCGDEEIVWDDGSPQLFYADRFYPAGLLPETVPTEPHLTYPLTQRQRLDKIIGRHVRDEDDALTDDAFVRAVMARYEAGRRDLLIDPNE